MIPGHAPTKRAALLSLMVLDRWAENAAVSVPSSRWYTQQELVAVGGLRFAARLDEVRHDGGALTYDTLCTDGGTGAHLYRLRQWFPSEERPGRRDSRLRQLEAENAELRRRLAGSSAINAAQEEFA